MVRQVQAAFGLRSKNSPPYNIGAIIQVAQTQRLKGVTGH